MAPVAPTVFVVDDDLSVREALDLLLSADGLRVETFGSAEAFMMRAPIDMPCCLVLDVSLPDVDGIALQKRIADRADLPIIFITGHGDIPTTVRAMKAGAVEFFTKPFEDDVLVSAIHDAIDRSCVAIEQAGEVQGLKARYRSLSVREQQVMALVVAGYLNKQVGFELGISEITVKAHRGRVMRKMAARSLPHLVNIAAKLAAVAKAER